MIGWCHKATMRSYNSLPFWALHCLWVLSICAVYDPLCLRGADRKPAEYFPLPDNKGGWQTATNASKARKLAGIDLGKLDTAWRFTERSTQNAGLLVVRNGYLVCERYVGRAGREVNPDMASTGKAYTSIACGIMLDCRARTFSKDWILGSLLRHFFLRHLIRRVLWMTLGERRLLSASCSA